MKNLRYAMLAACALVTFSSSGSDLKTGVPAFSLLYNVAGQSGAYVHSGVPAVETAAISDTSSYRSAIASETYYFTLNAPMEIDYNLVSISGYAFTQASGDGGAGATASLPI